MNVRVAHPTREAGGVGEQREQEATPTSLHSEEITDMRLTCARAECSWCRRVRQIGYLIWALMTVMCVGMPPMSFL